MSIANTKPNYKDGSILNLMSSIGKALGKKSKYSPLKLLPPEELKSKNLVVILIDGLGYNFFKKNGSSELKKHLKGKITSIFPSATSAAMTTFSTGLSPLDHEITGWFMYLKELGSTIRSLPYTLRVNKTPIENIIDISKLFNLTPFTQNLKCDSYYIYPEQVVDSEFSKAVTGKSKRKGYTTINGYFSEIIKILKEKRKKKFIFSYYPKHDRLCHEYGTKHKKTITHYKKVEKELIKFLKKIEGTDSTVIITADHGALDIPSSKVIDIKYHSKFKETLRLPLCGDPRYVYCYVKVSKVKEFKNYVKNNLNHCCKLYKGKDLVRKNYFGLTSPSKRFLDRIGDFVLIMKEDYTMVDFSGIRKPDYDLGDHGGISKDEMLVPLIVVKK